MKKLLIIFLVIQSVAYGQTFKGKLLNYSNNPVEEAYIQNVSKGNHSHSDAEGCFSLMKTFTGDTVVIISLGYEQKTIVISRNMLTETQIIKLKSKDYNINEVKITGNLKSLNFISDIDLNYKPVNTSQEVLRTVPGLFIGQHAGGGKAEQLFFRGFDLDHGTDIDITVDGIPVNLVSHAHGQGYADLHFLIPELIDKIDFGKGSYYADKGDFSTTGYINFKTKDKLENSSATVEYGMFNTLRNVSLIKLLNTENQNAYFACEYFLTDGAFDSPQNFSRINLTGKYSTVLNSADKLTFLVSYFTSKWSASGQIPERAVKAGLISRFGAIDDTEGGFTDRTNINLHYNHKINDNSFIKTNFFYTQYDFELYSDFTFFLNDSINGDQIRQKEHRQIFGSDIVLHRKYEYSKFKLNLKYGIGYLENQINGDELSHTKDRKITLEQIKLGNVYESNEYGFVSSEFNLNKWMINAAVRTDMFNFNYDDLLDTVYNSQKMSRAIVSPKLNIIYNHNHYFQLYLKTGKGFHSNDTRVIISKNVKEMLPASYGSDFGLIWKPFSSVIINSGIWYLFLEQEFVYVGDEGVIEPSGKTQRKGADFGIRWQIAPWLFLNNTVNWCYGRSIDEPAGKNYIPLAPDLTSTGGLSLKTNVGITGGIHYRYMKNRPANEDFSIIAKGYFITDLILNYKFKKIIFGISIDNLFNSDWYETQFATVTRMKNEAEAHNEIHFIPGTPFFLKGKITYRF